MGFNMQKLMKQAQKMQQDMARVQEELRNTEVEGVSGGGMVKVVANGSSEILSISIDPEIIDPDDAEMLEDMVAAAVNEAVRKVDEDADAAMQKITGGANFPGL